MKKIIFNLSIGILLLTINCASFGGLKLGNANDVTVERKEGFNLSTKKISTLSVYNLANQKLGDKSDVILNTLGASIDGRIAEMYGSSILGGDAISNLAGKLKLNNFESSVKNLIDSQINGVEFTAESKKTLSTITEKGKLDALAIPIVSDGFESLKAGGKISISVIIFDGKSSNIQIFAVKQGILAKSEDIALVDKKPDQAKANMNLSVLTASGELMDAIKKVVKGEGQTKISEITKIEQPNEVKDVTKENPEKETLSGIDEWLVSKIKVGIGPIILGFIGILFIIL